MLQFPRKVTPIQTEKKFIETAVQVLKKTTEPLPEPSSPGEGSSPAEELLEIQKEIRAGVYSVITNLVYRRKDNASAVLKEKRLWEILVTDTKKTEGGSAELRAMAVGLLVSALELLDDFDVTFFVSHGSQNLKRTKKLI